MRLRYEPGGIINEHWERFRVWRDRGNRVEVLGICASACTLVVSLIAKENLCFGPDATLKFHQARTLADKPAHASTEAMAYSYPEDIRRWIDDRGGPGLIPFNGYWHLNAPELWKMGYQRCN